jgi:hypothetical protein
VTKPPPPLKNVATSVRVRLTDRARARGENVQLVLTRFAIERLIFRLAASPHRDTFVLKGAMLFSLWAPVPYRRTGDLDLLGQGDAAPERMVETFRELCQLTVPDDGLDFDPQSVRTEIARADDEYAGVRVTLTATLANARLPIQVDIGFGDAVTPAPREVIYPSLLDFPEARLRAYPPETVVAEKLEALVALGMGNSRMKDFFDLWAIGSTFAFEGPALAAAVAATFARRRTPWPDGAPIALTDTFSGDAAKQAQWAGFLRRTAISLAPAPFPQPLAFVGGFVVPLLGADAVAALAGANWPPGGPWRIKVSDDAIEVV